MNNITEKELTQDDVFAQGNYLVRYALDGGGKDVLDIIYHFPLLANLDDAEHKSAFYFLIKDSLARLKLANKDIEHHKSLELCRLFNEFLSHPQVVSILKPENLSINDDDSEYLMKLKRSITEMLTPLSINKVESKTCEFEKGEEITSELDNDSDWEICEVTSDIKLKISDTVKVFNSATGMSNVYAISNEEQLEQSINDDTIVKFDKMKPKFKIGDTVFALKGGAVIKDIIVGMSLGRIDNHTSDNSITYYGSAYSNGWDESKVFATKQNLLDSL